MCATAKGAVNCQTTELLKMGCGLLKSIQLFLSPQLHQGLRLARLVGRGGGRGNVDVIHATPMGAMLKFQIAPPPFHPVAVPMSCTLEFPNDHG